MLSNHNFAYFFSVYITHIYVYITHIYYNIYIYYVYNIHTYTGVCLLLFYVVITPKIISRRGIVFVLHKHTYVLCVRVYVRYIFYVEKLFSISANPKNLVIVKLGDCVLEKISS